MPIVSAKDQAVVSEYVAMGEGFLPRMLAKGLRTPFEDVGFYRELMDDVERYLNPPGFKGVEIGSWEVARPLRAGLTAGVAVPQGEGPFPIMVHAHGHGLMAGRPQEYEGWMREMASHGVVVIFPDYRWQPEVSYEDQVEDMMVSIRWALANAKELKGDTNKLIVGGDSAGVALAMEVLLRELTKADGLRFKAFACVDGQLNFPQAEALIESIKPDTPLPPVHLSVGSADRNALIPVLRFTLTLAELGKDFEMDVAYGMPHDFVKMPQLDACKIYTARLMDFLKRACS